MSHPPSKSIAHMAMLPLIQTTSRTMIEIASPFPIQLRPGRRFATRKNPSANVKPVTR